MSSDWQNIFLRNFSRSLLFLINNRKKLGILKIQLIIFISGIILSGCTYKKKVFKSERLYPKNGVWKQTNSRIVKYVQVYKKNKHVKTCLDQAKSRR